MTVPKAMLVEVSWDAAVLVFGAAVIVASECVVIGLAMARNLGLSPS